MFKFVTLSGFCTTLRACMGCMHSQTIVVLLGASGGGGGGIKQR
jgi:hypothetical protein